MASLLDSLNDAVGRQPASELAARLGEPEENVRRGILTGASALLSEIGGRAREGGFLQRLLDLVQNRPPEAAAGIPSAAVGTADSGLSRLGSRMANMVLGNNQSAVSDALARSTGLGSSAAASVLEFAAAPAALGALRSRFSGSGMSMAGIQSMLTNEMPAIRNLLPSSLRSLIAPVTAGAPPVIATSGVVAEETSHASRWLLPLLLGLLLLLGLFWMLVRGRGTVEQAANRVASTASDVGAWLDSKLPNGVVLHVPPHGLEARLAQYLKDPAQQVSQEQWFDFDRLRFDTGSATLRPESEEQLRNIAAILTAYPSAKVKVGGYTDNVGDPANNLQLSQDRAYNVRNDLIGMGVAADRIEAAGYGDQFPVADNATEEGRARNRRIALRVMQK